MWRKNVKIVDKYVYLGLTIYQYLDCSVTARNVALSANRALGLLTVKFKILGGMPFGVF